MLFTPALVSLLLPNATYMASTMTRSVYHVVYTFMGAFLMTGSGSGKVSEVGVGVKSGGSEYCNDLRMDVNMILIISEQAQDCKTWHVRAWSWSQVEVPVLQAVVQL